LRGRLRTYKQGEKHLLDHFIPRQSHGTSLTVVRKQSIIVTSRYEALPRNAVHE